MNQRIHFFVYKYFPVTLFVFLLLSLLPVLFTGCGGSPEGYGVVLLSPNDQSIETGTLVAVEERSSLRETFTISPLEEKESIQVDQWRVEFFEEKEEARTFADSYSEYIPIFAENLRDGLAVRENPSTSSERIYRMKKGLEIKILKKMDKEETVGSNTDYWYRILTKDGVTGYSFGHYLNVYNVDAAPVEEEGPDLSRVKEVLTQTYRPEDLEEMKEKGHINLEKFSRDYGFFPDPEEKSFKIKTFDYTHSFDYDEIEKIDDESYVFLGPDVELKIEDEDEITLNYRRKDENYSPEFILIEDIDSIRKEERERREDRLEEIVESGPSYHSSAYGTLFFSKDGTFRWEDFDRLVPRILSSSENTEGELKFDHFIEPEVEGSYDGACTFLFNDSSGDPPVFLYSLEEGKLTLEYVSSDNIEKKVVKERNASPIIMAFFSQS
ncbi:MAG: SH3 domain-containing protein [Spirochaetia bacterium]